MGESRRERKQQKQRARARFMVWAGVLALAVALTTGAMLLARPSLMRGNPGPTPSPLPTLAPVPTPSPTPAPVATARMRFAGDVIIDTPMLESAYSQGSYRFGRYFARIADQLQDADLTVINVEGALMGQGEFGYSGYPSFNTPPSILGALKACGVDMLTLANNHALDRYFDGLMGTLKNVDAEGLLRVGAYRSQKDYDTPQVVDINGIQVGFTNYTTGLNGVEKRSDKRALQYGLRTTGRADYEADMRALRDAGAEVVVALMHWDREYKRLPEAETKKTARALAEAGADIIIGGHPHMVQPLEYLEVTDASGQQRQALVLYSMGNFLSNHKGEYLDNGVIFEVSLARLQDGSVVIAGLGYMPVWVWVQKGEERRNYQVLPIGQSIDARPEGMSDAQYERMSAAWGESLEILGTDIAQPIRG